MIEWNDIKQFVREMEMRIGETEFEDGVLKRILREEKENVLKTYEERKRGSDDLTKRCRDQLVDRMERMTEKYLRENSERGRVNEMFMKNWMAECRRVREWDANDG